jgi:dienelactone hydrolase
MSVIDVLLVGAILVVAGWRVFARKRGRKFLRPAPVVLAALALLQVAVEGFYWQLLPGYFVIAVLAVLSIFRHADATPINGLMRLAGQIALVILMGAVLAPWMLFLPVPQLTKPGGPYAVGTHIWRWVDTSRLEEATEDPADKRNVVVQAWYPAAPGAKGPHSTYVDGIGRLPSNVSVLPSFVMAHYDRIDTHGIVDAPVSTDRPTWPVVVFQNGYGAMRAGYTALITDLASRGYVVLAIDNPYEAAVTELADGRIATTVEKVAPGDPDKLNFMQGRLQLRIADVGFVLDQLARPDAVGPNLDDHLDLDHIGAVGHSLGGATSAAAMDHDPRIKAAVNIDGTLYGPISGERTPRPFLLIESDYAETNHSDLYQKGNQAFFDQFTGGDYRYQIARANHYSFTDLFLFFAPPGRFAASLLIGGARGPAETQRATVDILDAFLRGPLKGSPADVAVAAAKYQGVAGGPVGAGVSPAAR